jgi:hypothetical protein
LNIGNPEKQQEYLKKYQEIDAAMPPLIGNLAALARTDVHLPQDLQAKAAALPALYADYRSGFFDTVRRLWNDPNLTPQQANVLMAKFKPDIPVLEADMAAVAEASDRMVEQILAQAVQQARKAYAAWPTGYERVALKIYRRNIGAHLCVRPQGGHAGPPLQELSIEG